MKFVSFERLAHFKDLLTQLINTKAPLESPEFTGSPTTPTPINNDNGGKQVVNQQYLFNQMDNALNQVNNMLAGYLPLTGGTVTGATTFTDTIYAPYIESSTGITDGFSLNSNSGLRLVRNSRTNYIRLDTTGANLLFGVRGTGTTTNVYTLNGDGTTNDNDIATKYYVDNEVATSVADYLPLTGGILTGALTVPSIGGATSRNSYGLNSDGLIFFTRGTSQRTYNIFPDANTGSLVVQTTEIVQSGNITRLYKFNGNGVTNDDDITNKAYVDTQVNSIKVWEGMCSTIGTDAAKVVTVDKGFTLTNGVKVKIYFENANSNLTPTLNVNNTGAYDIIPADGGALPSGGLIGSGFYTFTYTLTYWGTASNPYYAWVLDNVQIGNTGTYGVVKVVDGASANFTAQKGYAVSPKGLQDIAYEVPFYGICTTAATVANKTAAVSNRFVLKDGAKVIVWMQFACDSAQTNLNINNTGNIMIANVVDGNNIPDGSWKANEIVEFVYNEEYAQWIILNHSQATAARLGMVKTITSINTLKKPNNTSYNVPSVDSIYNALTLLNSYVSGDTASVFTLSASLWTSDNTFSLEANYPSAQYNLKISISSTATAEQYAAYNAAGIVGDDSSNVLKAMNGKPTIDIPVKIEAYVKNWSDA